MEKQGFSVCYKDYEGLFQSLKREPVMPVIVSVNPKQPDFDFVVDFGKKLSDMGLFTTLYTLFS